MLLSFDPSPHGASGEQRKITPNLIKKAYNYPQGREFNIDNPIKQLYGENSPISSTTTKLICEHMLGIRLATITCPMWTC